MLVSAWIQIASRAFANLTVYVASIKVLGRAVGEFLVILPCIRLIIFW
jgi:hypothetical protein